MCVIKSIDEIFIYVDITTSDFIAIQTYQSINASPAHKIEEKQFFIARFLRGNRERWENYETNVEQIIKFRYTNEKLLFFKNLRQLYINTDSA